MESFNIIRPLGLDLKTHCVRTWIYVRDIDSNYAGLVKARNDVFAEEGLSPDTHYIASTGIGGATESRNAVVAIDFLTRPDLRRKDFHQRNGQHRPSRPRPVRGRRLGTDGPTAGEYR